MGVASRWDFCSLWAGGFGDAEAQPLNSEESSLK